ncbi:hypothetical protein BMW24_022955 [Mycobacterium heckeshornense]|uniref:type II toxin-antitoxin system RelE family toxin n=1 Tax=Mycobacterium heckeshornense TaxID=110505 RepID=UPI0006625F39|nr:hypothetical protein [Mycobacterium heckeshornense]KMV23259.1 hypothetical protein ACT16_06095 [Mycobacterium heckeshornense]PIJ29463.1 hypothetical protein BMW24_022955 [Mycobacterium heckeshornense]
MSDLRRQVSEFQTPDLEPADRDAIAGQVQREISGDQFRSPDLEPADPVFQMEHLILNRPMRTTPSPERGWLCQSVGEQFGIVYAVDDVLRMVTVTRVGHRKEVYKR